MFIKFFASPSHNSGKPERNIVTKKNLIFLRNIHSWKYSLILFLENAASATPIIF